MAATTLPTSQSAGGASSASTESTAKPKGAGQALAKIALVCGSLVFMFLAAEVALRVLGIEPQTATALNAYFQYDSEAGWGGRPNVGMRFATTAFAGYTSHGPDGFRTVSKAYRGAKKVVWCVGDSGTWGWGVNDGETYTDGLNNLSPADTAFRNLGVCGFSTVQEHLMIRHLLEKFPDQKPSTVLLLFCENDLPENVDDKDQSPPRPYYLVANGEVELHNYPTQASSMSVRSWFKRHSLAYNHLNFYLTMAKRAMKNRDFTGQPAVPEQRPGSEWAALRHGYEQIRDLCVRNNIQFVPVFLAGITLRYGDRMTPELGASEEATRAKFIGMTESLGLDAIDLTPDMKAYFTTQGQDAERLSFKRDPHFNANGHALISRAVWAKLGRELR